jgi:hypothetical protein
MWASNIGVWEKYWKQLDVCHFDSLGYVVGIWLY